MQKEELLHLHQLMYTIRGYIEVITHGEILTERYNSLEISPFYIHKDKNAHTKALLTLGDEIISHIHTPALPVVYYAPEKVPLQVAAGQ